ncbi:MAG: protein-tyrosine-phosphatase [Bacteroidota bacterium]
MQPLNMVLVAAFPAVVLPPFASSLEGSLGGGTYPLLTDYLENLNAEFSEIEEDRRADLRKMADYVTRKRASEKEANLVFICTHNSRRSHMAQIWAQTVAHHLGLSGVTTYSGGTDATAFNPRAVAAMKEAGFKIKQRNNSSNPVYTVSFASGAPSTEAFSKKFSDPSNPQEDFCAVMVCSQADEACPYVPGAEKRFSIPYEDPKAFDGTPQESEKYSERSRQIAREMLYLFTRVK